VGGNPGFTFNGVPVTQATIDDTQVQTGGLLSPAPCRANQCGASVPPAFCRVYSHLL